MSLKSSNKRCIYCLKYFEKVDDEHVLPESWYPAENLKKQKKWQVPACKNCNQIYSKVEGNLLQRFGLGFNPEDPIYGVIANSSARAINESSARNEKDRRCRKKRKENIIKDVYNVVSNFKYSDYSDAIIPFGNPNESRTPLLIPVIDLKVFAEKIVRGLTYTLTNTYIEPPHEIDISLWPQWDPEVYNFLIKEGKDFTIGNFFQAKYFFDSTSQVIICDFKVWNRFFGSAVIQNVGLAPTSTK